MQDNKQLSNQSSTAGSVVPNIVKDIPLAAPDGKPQPVNEDDELDSIMRDVGRDLKQIGQKNPKHHWFSKSKEDKAEPKFSARPAERSKSVPAAPPPPKPAAATPRPVPAGAPSAAKPAAPAKAPKPVKTSQTPFGIIFLVVIVTAGLITAAYFAYK